MKIEFSSDFIANDDSSAFVFSRIDTWARACASTVIDCNRRSDCVTILVQCPLYAESCVCGVGSIHTFNIHHTIVMVFPGKDYQHWMDVPREYYRLSVVRHLIMSVRGR